MRPIVFALIVLAAASALATTASAGRLFGDISADGKPLPAGVKVRVTRPGTSTVADSTTTDKFGSYKLLVKEEGKSVLTVFYENKPLEHMRDVPLPIQRKLAREGRFLSYFVSHSNDRVARETLPHLLRLEDVTPFLRIVLAFNPGISYSLFSVQSPAGRWALLGLTLAATAALALWLWRAPDGLTASGLGLIVGGALGNGVDRLIYGAVADFLNFRLGSFSPFGVFNLADTAIFAGVGLLLYRTFYPSGPIRP